MADTFTPEQIAQILEEFFKVVGTRQYIGARYVPIFGRKDEESIEWDNSAPYEPLTIVLYQGNSYTSRQYVPVGVEITNQEFWAITGNYNAQVEMYRRETAAAREIANNALATANNALAAANDAQDDINALLPKADFSAENTVKNYIDRNTTRVLSFDTVADMQNASYLEAGMTCHTDGFYANGDGGAMWYRISDTGTANNMNVIACGNLFANAIISDSTVTVDTFGAHGDDYYDDADVIQYCIDYAIEHNYNVRFNRKIYKVSKTINVNSGQNSIRIYGESNGFGPNRTKCSAIHMVGLNAPVFSIPAMLRSSMEYLYIYADDNSCVGISAGDIDSTSDIISLGTFNYIYVEGCNGFALNHCAYCYLYNCNWFMREDVEGFGVSITGEYVYLVNCNIASSYDFTQEQIGIDVQQGQYIYIQDCDVPNFTNGIAIRLKPSRSGFGIKNVTIENTTLVRAACGIYVDTTNGSVYNTKCKHIGLFGTAQYPNRAAYITRSGVGTCINFEFEGFYEGPTDVMLFDLGSTYIPLNFRATITLPTLATVHPDFNQNLLVLFSTVKYNPNITVSSATNKATIFTYNGKFPTGYRPEVKLYRTNGTIPSDAVYAWEDNDTNMIYTVSSQSLSHIFFAAAMTIDW